MKLSKQQQEQIINLKNQGYGSRFIAATIGCGKSTVNDFWNKFKQTDEYWERVAHLPPISSLNILFIDVETSADLVATFGRKQVNLSQSNIVCEGNQLISCAVSWLDSPDVKVFSSEFENFEINLESEKRLLQRLVEYFKQADVVVAHNAMFDIGTIQTRMLVHGLGKLPTTKIVDTLQIARKYLRLRSNKLDSITKYFGLSNKLETEGISLWINAQRGCPEALATMVKYNAQDVVALKDIYQKFVPLNAGFNQGLLTDHEGHVCSNCGSHHVQKTGRLVHTTVSAFEEFECNDCGTKLRGRVNVLDKEKRKHLLVAL